MLNKAFFIIIFVITISYSSNAIAPKDLYFSDSFYGFSISIHIVLIDNNNDGCYDHGIIFVDGKYYWSGPLIFINKGPLQGEPFPDDCFIENFQEIQCQDQTYSITFDVNNEDSVKIAEFSRECSTDTAYYDYLPNHPIISIIDNDISNISEYLIFPNPVADFIKLNISSKDDILSIGIFDILGNKVTVPEYSKSISNQKIEYNILLNNFNPGFYYLVVYKSDSTLSIPFIKN